MTRDEAISAYRDSLSTLCDALSVVFNKNATDSANNEHINETPSNAHLPIESHIPVPKELENIYTRNEYAKYLYEKAGIKIIAERNRCFFLTRIPAGWKIKCCKRRIKEYDHERIYHVIDETGVKRFSYRTPDPCPESAAYLTWAL